MAGEWRTCRLGDVIELKRGYDLPAAKRRPGAIPIVSSSGVSGTHKEAMVAGPGVVTGRYGTIGEVFYVTENFWPLNTTLYVCDFKGSSPRFVAYFLKTIDFSAYSDKAAVPGVNRNHLHEATVAWPPIDEQRAIGEVLGALDDKIELNRRMAEALEAIARALFKSWFVDFDPVRAKTEGRPSGLPDNFAALFPANFNENGLPAGWRREPLRTQVDVLSGGTPSKVDSRYWGGGLPWVTPRSMTQSQVFDTEERVTQAAVGNGTRQVPGGSIMVMVRGMGLHQGVRISQAQRDVTFNQDVKALVPKGLDSAFFLYFMLDCQEMLLTKVRASGHGTGVLPSDALEDLLIPVPPAPVQQRLFEPFRLFNARMALSRIETSTLASLRDTLLPKLISGELRVADAEKRIAAA